MHFENITIFINKIQFMKLILAVFVLWSTALPQIDFGQNSSADSVSAHVVNFFKKFWYEKMKISRALLRAFPKSLSDGLRFNTATKIDINIAEKEYKNYCSKLKQMLPNGVLEFKARDDAPDSVFIEDCLVTFQKKCLVTHPGHLARRIETIGLKKQLLDWKLPFEKLDEMKEIDHNAFCDGGDVLELPNKYPWFGMPFNKKNINKKIFKIIFFFLKQKSWCAAVVAKSLGVNVITIDIAKAAKYEILHLKSALTWVDSNLLVGYDIPVMHNIFSEMQDKCKLPLEVVWVNSLACANVLRINNCLLVPQGFPQCQHQIQKKLVGKSIQVDHVDNSELRKLDSGLTCLSVLLSI
ncbi:dimethylarginine dimethylaminohydrolase 1 [Reticulomyxa filosa]|uniref:Dimethylarginine dimethylaminohydrolase 1 n=1 Tax=Reticulomyxa filosa TaxID=46433 RepID=X6NYB8_RETFI|nr:dimethylarginine dimethylaminohydrolase 1 [Reticulomyxa filosa]|eukprot:ETO30287.1 dimethylarginine dimethylaminohydrolase 1 [Reticulomyxa filosa]